ncbi:hybrid sensor histidine kinase/response regulator [Hyphomicrobium methylovorum]|uniref:hybrid sensor histidine kinase/response regulator n=1 Tax=Hyphomicrobium methylovorum TaxID=84 RepID=UPI001FE56D37|nr:PAS domain-containing sensor histidine kinase [Hyphomicrobium methylovorum]
MKDREALRVDAAPIDPLITAEGFGSFLPTIIIVAATAALVFGLLASGSAEPLLLTIIAVLAMLGMFLLFGVAAGHIRVGPRVAPGDLLKAAADSAAEPQIIAHDDGTVVYANAAMERMFGRHEVGPFAALESTMNTDPEAAQALYRLMRAAERGEAHTEEIPLRPAAHRSTSFVRIAVRPFAAPLSDADASSADKRLVLWRIADISTEKAYEEQRIGNLQASLTAFDAMPAGFMAISGADGTIRHVNAAFEQWLGYQTGTLRSRRLALADLAGPEGARLLKQLAEIPESDQRVVDLDLTRRDGRMVPLTLLVEPAEEGVALGFTITAINRVTAGLVDRSDQDVRASQFFQSAPFGIAALDGEGRIANCNAAFMRLVLDGRPAQDMFALDVLAKTADRGDRTRIETGLAEVLAGRGNVQPVEITTGDQKQITCRVFMSPLAAIAGGAAAVLYVIDATEQKVLESRVAQSEKMEAVGNLAGGIAHDFNNVLTAIIGFSDLLLQTHRPSDPAYKDIKNIQSAANRAAGLVAGLLGFSRKQTQQVTTVNLGELTADMKPILKTQVGDRIELKIQPERDLWYVRADSDQLFNIVLNLVRNARDAMPSGGSITIRTRNVNERESQKMGAIVGIASGEYVLVEVADTGTGMSPEVMAKIFEPFFTTKGVGKGTGLGLASVYGIVKQSGGFIFPESEIGKGTTFKLLLPRYLADENDETDRPQQQPQSMAAARRDLNATDLTGTGRVLLVEDEVEVRQFAVRALKRQGYQVLEAADGVEALEIMAENEGMVDIVVSDVVMPEMDGPSLFKELRKRNPSIKVIFVSGYPNEAFRESMGSDDFAFLPKPFSLPQLAAKVKEELAS